MADLSNDKRDAAENRHDPPKKSPLGVILVFNFKAIPVKSRVRQSLVGLKLAERNVDILEVEGVQAVPGIMMKIRQHLEDPSSEGMIVDVRDWRASIKLEMRCQEQGLPVRILR